MTLKYVPSVIIFTALFLVFEESSCCVVFVLVKILIQPEFNSFDISRVFTSPGFHLSSIILQKCLPLSVTSSFFISQLEIILLLSAEGRLPSKVITNLINQSCGTIKVKLYWVQLDCTINAQTWVCSKFQVSALLTLNYIFSQGVCVITKLLFKITTKGAFLMTSSQFRFGWDKNDLNLFGGD